MVQPTVILCIFIYPEAFNADNVASAFFLSLPWKILKGGH